MKILARKTAILAGILACTFPAMAVAQPVEEKNLKSGKDQITSDNGYIFMYGDARFAGVFLKLPDADDIAEYEADWEEKFAKARKKYERQAASYESRAEHARRNQLKVPERPVEPTPENFFIDPIEFRNMVSFGPQFVYAKAKAKGKKIFSYLQQVEPGTYVYYGPINLAGGNGVVGHCLCMGSIQFDVKPGVITNLGEALELGGTMMDSMNVDHDGAAIALNLKPYPMKYVDYDLPEYLQQFESEIADLRASKKYPNRFGIPMERMRPLEGILAYDRDRPIDVKSELAKTRAAVAAEAAESAADVSGATAGGEELPTNAETAPEPAAAEAAESE